MVESLCYLTAAFSSSRLPHHVMKRSDGVVPQRERFPGLVRALLYGSDVNVMCREEVLCLRSQLRFHVIERELLPAVQPSRVGEQRSSPMIHVDVDRPMRENNVGLIFFQQQFCELLISLSGNFA